MLDHSEPVQQDAAVDDRFRALMEGLRTTLPGVGVLFAFLLTMPLNASFSDLAGLNTTVYYLSFVSTTVALILLIAPSVHQRLRAAEDGVARTHEHHVQIAVHLTNVGTAFFAVAIAAAAYLVTSLVVGTVMAGLVAGVAAATIAVTWFYLPMVAWKSGS